MCSSGCLDSGGGVRTSIGSHPLGRTYPSGSPSRRVGGIAPPPVFSLSAALVCAQGDMKARFSEALARALTALDMGRLTPNALRES